MVVVYKFVLGSGVMMVGGIVFGEYKLVYGIEFCCFLCGYKVVYMVLVVEVYYQCVFFKDVVYFQCGWLQLFVCYIFGNLFVLMVFKIDEVRWIGYNKVYGMVGEFVYYINIVFENEFGYGSIFVV